MGGEPVMSFSHAVIALLAAICGSLIVYIGAEALRSRRGGPRRSWLRRVATASIGPIWVVEVLLFGRNDVAVAIYVGTLVAYAIGMVVLGVVEARTSRHTGG